VTNVIDFIREKHLRLIREALRTRPRKIVVGWIDGEHASAWLKEADDHAH
jgi:Flp pilus assembly CpaF family ATPase